MESKQADNKTLRIFVASLTMAVIIWALIFSFVFNNELTYLPVLSIFLSTFFISGMVAPKFYHPFYKGWAVLATRVNRAVIAFLLFLIYFVIITPVALVRRWSGTDQLRKPPYLKDSYRQTSKPLQPSDMEKPF